MARDGQVPCSAGQRLLTQLRERAVAHVVQVERAASGADHQLAFVQRERRSAALNADAAGENEALQVDDRHAGVVGDEGERVGDHHVTRVSGQRQRTRDCRQRRQCRVDLYEADRRRCQQLGAVKARQAPHLGCDRHRLHGDDGVGVRHVEHQHAVRIGGSFGVVDRAVAAHDTGAPADRRPGRAAFDHEVRHRA